MPLGRTLGALELMIGSGATEGKMYLGVRLNWVLFVTIMFWLLGQIPDTTLSKGRIVDHYIQ